MPKRIRQQKNNLQSSLDAPNWTKYGSPEKYMTALEDALTQALGNIETLTSCCTKSEQINNQLIEQCQKNAPLFRDFLRSVAGYAGDVSSCLREGRYDEAERLTDSLRETAHHIADGFAEYIPGVHTALMEGEKGREG